MQVALTFCLGPGTDDAGAQVVKATHITRHERSDDVAAPSRQSICHWHQGACRAVAASIPSPTAVGDFIRYRKMSKPEPGTQLRGEPVFQRRAVLDFRQQNVSFSVASFCHRGKA